MSEHPTPEQALNEGLRWAVFDEEAKAAIDYMREKYGYVIVHPDDVPERDYAGPYETPADVDYDIGWNACRTRIFGANP